MSQSSNKYTTIIHKAISPDPEIRYGSIDDMLEDIRKIIQRVVYQSPQEVVADPIDKYKRTGILEVVELSSALQKDTDDQLLWELVLDMKNSFVDPFVILCRTDYELAVVAITRLYTYTTDTFTFHGMIMMSSHVGQSTFYKNERIQTILYLKRQLK